MAFISFNEEKNGGRFPMPGLPDPETQEDEAALREPMPLNTPWVLWEQVSGGQYSTKNIVTFRTAQEFWKVWNGVPQPSELLENKRFFRDSSPIDAIMLFREGIQPQWEDPANQQGGKFQVTLKPLSGSGQIDEYWNNLVLAMVGETMEAGQHVTGVRLVDKLSGKQKVTDHIRLELWYNSKTSTSEVKMLRSSMERILTTRADGSPGPQFKTDAIQDKRHQD